MKTLEIKILGETGTHTVTSNEVAAILLYNDCGSENVKESYVAFVEANVERIEGMMECYSRMGEFRVGFSDDDEEADLAEEMFAYVPSNEEAATEAATEEATEEATESTMKVLDKEEILNLKDGEVVELRLKKTGEVIEGVVEEGVMNYGDRKRCPLSIMCGDHIEVCKSYSIEVLEEQREELFNAFEATTELADMVEVMRKLNDVSITLSDYYQERCRKGIEAYKESFNSYKEAVEQAERERNQEFSTDVLDAKQTSIYSVCTEYTTVEGLIMKNSAYRGGLESCLRYVRDTIMKEYDASMLRAVYIKNNDTNEKLLERVF